MRDAMKAISESGILPVLGLTNEKTAPRLAKALMDGGINVLEVTLRTKTAIDCIRAIRQAYPDMVVGAGTVMDCETVEQAKAAGAEFIVTPCLNIEVIRKSKELGLPVVPGCVTPTEIDMAAREGLGVVKFFPAEISGGLAAINQISGPMPQIRFIPTGGLDFSNIEPYLESPKIVAVGGSFIAKSDMINGERWDEISEQCRKARDIALGFRLAHIGINQSDEKEACETAKWFSEVFRMPFKNGNSSVFAGKAVECMKMKYLGTNGHIGFSTSSMERAVAYLRGIGAALNEDSFRYNASGGMVSVYFEREMGGFAVHIVQR